MYVITMYAYCMGFVYTVRNPIMQATFQRHTKLKMFKYSLPIDALLHIKTMQKLPKCMVVIS